MIEEAKADADRFLRAAQTAVSQMKEWHAEKYARNEYDDALNQFNITKQHYNTNSYFGYQDAVESARETESKAIEAFNKQRNALSNSAKDEYKAAKNTLDRADELNVKQGASDKYQTAQNKFREAQKQLETHTYAGYNKAIDLSREVVSILRPIINGINRRRVEAEKHRKRAEKESKAIGAAIRKAILPIVVGVILGSLFYRMDYSFSGPGQVWGIITIIIGILSGIVRGWSAYKDVM